jgi:hypothetical protein
MQARRLAARLADSDRRYEELQGVVYGQLLVTA